MIRKTVILILFILLCQLPGIIGSYFTVSSIPVWYAGLNKPWFNPPNFLFGPVWFTLYVMMGISLYMVWNANNNVSKKTAVIVFSVQLVLNALWSIIFFGMRNPGLAFIEIILLWVFILLSIIKFYHVSRKASYILIPYLLWVSYASVLNFSIWRLN
jgi:tryptophan-rich sensory protein